MDATTRRDARTLLALLALLVVLSTVLSYGVRAGYAAAPTPVPASAPFPAVEPTKDLGDSDWFRDACGDPAHAKAGCGVQVVSNASGITTT